MKRILLAILALSLSALAQNPGARFGDSQPIRSRTSITGLSNAFPTIVPNAVIQVCTYPANAVPCTNLATTYTDATLSTQCSTSTQITYAGSNTCVGATDIDGSWGVWVFPAQYEWTYTLADGTSHGPYPVIATGLVISGGGGGGAQFDPGANTYMVYVDNSQTGNVGTDSVFNYDKNTHTLKVPQMSVTGAGGYQFVGQAGTVSGSGDPTKSNCGFDASSTPIPGQLACGNLGAAPKKMLRSGEVDEHVDVVHDGVVVTNENADRTDGAHASVTPSAGIIPIADGAGRLAPGFIPTGQVQPTAGTGSPLVYTTLAADYGRLIKSNMTGGGTVQLMNAAIRGYFFWVTNVSATAVNVDATPVCACLLNGSSTAVSVPSGQTIVVWFDGTNYFSSQPIVGNTGVTVTNGLQKLGISYTGSQVSSWCQGLPGTAASFVSAMVGFKAANAVTCADATTVEQVATAAFTVSHLYCKAGVAGAAADSGNCFFYKNGAQSTLTCTMGTGTSCNDATHIVSLAAGDTYSLRMVNDAAGTDTVQNVRISVLFQ